MALVLAMLAGAWVPLAIGAGPDIQPVPAVPAVPAHASPFAGLELPAVPELPAPGPAPAMPDMDARTAQFTAEALAALEVSSAPGLAQLQEATEAAQVMLALGLDPRALPEVVIQADLLIPSGVHLDIPLLSIVVLGDVVIQPGASLKLYGARLDVRDYWLYNPSLYPYMALLGAMNPAESLESVLFVQPGGTLELWDLHNYTAEVPGVGPETLGLSDALTGAFTNAGSVLESADPALVAALYPYYYSAGLYPSSLLTVTAWAGSTVAIHNSLVRNLAALHSNGTLLVEDSTVTNGVYGVGNFATAPATGPQEVRRTRIASMAYFGVANAAPTPNAFVVEDSTITGPPIYGVYSASSTGLVVEDNAITAAYGVYLASTADSRVERNTIGIVAGYWGVFVVGGPGLLIADNTIASTGGLAGGGIYVASGVAPRILRNQMNGPAITMLYGIVAAYGPDPEVADNSIKAAYLEAINVALSQRALVTRNLVRKAAGYGIDAEASTGARVLDNDIAQGGSGVNAFRSQPGNPGTTDLLVQGNTLADLGAYGVVSYVGRGIRVVDNTMDRVTYGILGQATEMTATGNLIRTGAGWGISTYNADLVAWDNLVQDHGGAGISQQYNAFDSFVPPPNARPPLTDLRDNTVLRSGRGDLANLRAGIELLSAPAAAFEGNVMEDNAVGVSIPYNSRQTLLVANDNWVNGFNIDGTLVPADQVYWFGGMGCENGLTVAGRTYDPSHGGQFAGVINVQGIVTAYDCSDVVVTGLVAPRNSHGVYAWNVQGLEVTNGLFEDNNVSYAGALGDTGERTSGAVFASLVSPLHVADNAAHRSLTAYVDRLSEGLVEHNLATDAFRGIRSVGSSVSINDNTVRDADTGIEVQSGGNQVSRNVVEHSKVVGIHLVLASPVMEDDVVLGTGGLTGGDLGFLWFNRGVEMSSASPELVRGLITDTNRAVIGTASGPSTRDLVVRDNTYGLVFTQGSAPTLGQGTQVLGSLFGLQASASGVTIAGARFESIAVDIAMTGGSFDVSRSTLTSTPGFSAVGLAAVQTSGTLENTYLTGLRSGLNQSASSITCTHCEFSGNVWAGDALNTGSMTLEDTLVSGNAFGFRSDAGAVLTVRASNLVGQGDYAVKNGDTATSINARNNWWGQAAAPPASGANSAQGNVLKTPFLGAPDADAGVLP